jgi:hypothetical protein
MPKQRYIISFSYDLDSSKLSREKGNIWETTLRKVTGADELKRTSEALKPNVKADFQSEVPNTRYAEELFSFIDPIKFSNSASSNLNRKYQEVFRALFNLR